MTVASRRYLRFPVYLGRVNAFTLRFRQQASVGAPWTAVSWSNVSYFELALVDDDGLEYGPFTSVAYSDLVDSSVDGELALQLGGLPVAAGDYYLRLVAVDGAGKRTQLMHEANAPDVVLVDVVGTTSAS